MLVITTRMINVKIMYSSDFRIFIIIKVQWIAIRVLSSEFTKIQKKEMLYDSISVIFSNYFSSVILKSFLTVS